MMFIIQFVIVQTIIFLVVFFVLRRMMIQNTLSATNRLKFTDEENLKRLEEAKKKIEGVEADYRRKSDELEKELEQKQEAAKKQTEEAKNKVQALAHEESEKILAAARLRAEKMDEAREKEFQTRLIDLAGRMVQKVLSPKMKTALHEQWMEELLQEFEAQDIGQVPEQSRVAEVILPCPLTPNTRKKIEGILERKLGRKMELKETVKKGMAGGLILSIDSLVMDGSLENKLNLISRELKKKSG